MTQKEPAAKPGDVLPNGALVIAHKWHKNGIDQYVLCVWKKDNEYVSWAIDNDRNTYWGHYAGRDFFDAADFFKTRGE